MGSRKLYMHTLDSEPAEFHDGVICFAFRRVRKFATSLRQIRREQQRSRAARTIYSSLTDTSRYDYVILYPPEGET